MITKVVATGQPVRILDPQAAGRNDRMVGVELPNGEKHFMDRHALDNYGEQEEALSVLADQCGISHQVLRASVREGRLIARQTGTTWLTTVTAIEYAISKGRIRRTGGNDGR